MLVVDGIEFIVLNQASQVGKLKRQDSKGFQQQLEAFNEIVDVRDLGQHIVADDQVRRFSPSSKFQRELRTEKTSQRWHALFDCDHCDVCGRFNPQNWNALFDEVLQEVAVVTRNLNDKALRAQTKSIDDFRCV